jgi:hypothetical protein
VDGVDTPKATKTPCMFRVVSPAAASVVDDEAAPASPPEDVLSLTLTTTNGVVRLDNIATTEASLGGLYSLTITDVTVRAVGYCG